MANGNAGGGNSVPDAANRQEAGPERARIGARGESHFLIYATFAGADAAELAGHAIVADGLARCVNVLPQMTSIYRWQGKIETAREAVLIAKVTRAACDGCVARIKALHDYELPAILVIPVVGGFAPYLDWLATSDAAP